MSYVQETRLEELWQCIQGLRSIEKQAGLHPTGKAALEAVTRLYTRGRQHGGFVTIDEMEKPCAAARRIIEKAGVTCAPW